MLWWKPNHTSLPLPSRYGSPSGGAKKERPTGVYLCVCQGESESGSPEYNMVQDMSYTMWWSIVIRGCLGDMK